MAAAGVEDPEVAVMAAREVVATVAEPRSEAVAMAVAPASGAAIVVMGLVQEPDALVATTGLECEAVAAMPTTGDQEFATPTSIEAIWKGRSDWKNGDKRRYSGRDDDRDGRNFNRHRVWRNGAWVWIYGPDIYAYGDDCWWLLRRAEVTGSPYWWRRYEACVY
jgi:hypothetical protein